MFDESIMVAREALCEDGATGLLTAEEESLNRAWVSLAGRERFLQAIIDAEPDDLV